MVKLDKLVELVIKGNSPVAKTYLEKAALRVLHKIGISKSVQAGLFFVSDRKIRGLNKKFRDKDKATDVLSFPLENIKCKIGRKVVCQLPKTLQKQLYLGDIFISTQTAEKQALRFGHAYKKEIELLFIHGLMHLCGLDHEKSARENKVWHKIQDEIIRKSF